MIFICGFTQRVDCNSEFEKQKYYPFKWTCFQTIKRKLTHQVPARSLVEAKYFTEFFGRNNFPLFILEKCFHIIYIKLTFPTKFSYKTRLSAKDQSTKNTEVKLPTDKTKRTYKDE